MSRRQCLVVTHEKVEEEKSKRFNLTILADMKNVHYRPKYL